MFLRGRRLRKCKEQRIGSEPTTLGILFTSLTPFCSTVLRMNHFFISCNFSFDRKDHVFLTLIAIPFAVLPEVICSCWSSTELQAPQLWSSCSYLFVILFFFWQLLCVPLRLDVCSPWAKGRGWGWFVGPRFHSWENSSHCLLNEIRQGQLHLCMDLLIPRLSSQVRTLQLCPLHLMGRGWNHKGYCARKGRHVSWMTTSNGLEWRRQSGWEWGGSHRIPGIRVLRDYNLRLFPQICARTSPLPLPGSKWSDAWKLERERQIPRATMQ